MFRFSWIWLVFVISIGLIGTTACDNLSRGEPILPQSVVDAIAGESVKIFETSAPEGSILVEDARLVTYWGKVPSDEAVDYSDVICYQSEIKYYHEGVERKLYYQGVVKKPSESDKPWYMDEVSGDSWYEYSCGS